VDVVEHTNFEQRFRDALRALGTVKPKPPKDDDPDEGFEFAQGDDTLAKLSQVQPPTPINLFQHPDVHPVVLDLCLLKKYGPDWLYWESETLRWRIPQDFRTSSSDREASVSDLNMGKVQAMKNLHYNDTYWQRWEVFNWCTQPLNYVYVDFEIMQPPSTAQMMVSVDTSAQVRSDVEWSDEVKDFIKVACRFDGVFCPPLPLDFVEVGTEHGLLDCEDVMKRWPLVRKENRMPETATPEDEQLRRNLEAHRFLEANRERLRNQLPLVLNV
jgi:hypothetical protein